MVAEDLELSGAWASELISSKALDFLLGDQGTSSLRAYEGLDRALEVDYPHVCRPWLGTVLWAEGMGCAGLGRKSHGQKREGWVGGELEAQRGSGCREPTRLPTLRVPGLDRARSQEPGHSEEVDLEAACCKAQCGIFPGAGQAFPSLPFSAQCTRNSTCPKLV